MSLNFGKYSLKFNNNNQDADHPNWDITFDNINTNADTFDGHQYSQFTLVVHGLVLVIMRQ